MPTLRSLDTFLTRKPSVKAFRAILEALNSLEGAELRKEMARAESALASWPDEARCAGDAVVTEEFIPGAMFRPTAALVRKLEFEPSHGGCLPSFVEEIARAPEFAQLTTLSLFAEDIDSDGAIAIATSPTLHNLRDLRLGQSIGDGGFCAIARSTSLHTLEKLQLGGTLTEDETAVELANAPIMSKLVLFQWDSDDLSDEGFWALGMSRYIPNKIREEFLSCLDQEALRARLSTMNLNAEGASRKAMIAILMPHTLVAC